MFATNSLSSLLFSSPFLSHTLVMTIRIEWKVENYYFRSTYSFEVLIFRSSIISIVCVCVLCTLNGSYHKVYNSAYECVEIESNRIASHRIECHLLAMESPMNLLWIFTIFGELAINKLMATLT